MMMAEVTEAMEELTVEQLVEMAEAREKAEEERAARERERHRKEREEHEEKLFGEMMEILGPAADVLRPHVSYVGQIHGNILPVEVKLPQVRSFKMTLHGGKVTFHAQGWGTFHVREGSEEELAQVGRLIRDMRGRWKRDQEIEAAERAEKERRQRFVAQYERWEEVCAKVEARNRRHLAEIQASVDVPFRVWKVRYGATADGGPQTAVIETAIVLEPEADADGWWTALKVGGELFGGEVRKFRVCNVLGVVEEGCLVPSEHPRYARRLEVPGPYKPVFVPPAMSEQEVAEVRALIEELVWARPPAPDAEDYGVEWEKVRYLVGEW